MGNIRVLGIGVATMDIYVDRKRMYPGGNEYNVVCNAKQLGAEAGFLGVFANDVAGRVLEDTLTACGVDTSMSHHEKGSSGYSLVKVLEDGDRVFLDWNKAGVTDLFPIEFSEKELAYCKKFDVASLGRCASVSIEKIKFLADNGVALCYDFHATFGKTEILRYAPYAKYAFFSCSHLTISEIMDVLKLAIECGCEVAVGTRGADSVFAYDGVRYYEQETLRVHATDALGAGDSYIGAFLVNYIGACKGGMDQSKAIRQALSNAAKHSATVVVKEGSIGVGYDVDPDHIDEIINLKKI